MKRWIALFLTIILAAGMSACGRTKGSDDALDLEGLTAHIDSVMDEQNFKGVVCVTYNGEIVFRTASGTDELGEELDMDSNMYIGSVSKQFCAAAIMMLRDRGDLSVEDTLEMYFPEYEIGKDITLKNLLTMRSGIMDMVNQGSVEGLTTDEEENIALIKEWIFSRPLQFEPNTDYAYSNSNFFLLANIVEQVSGERYIDFVRGNIFEPLGMEHSGFLDEVRDDPAWMKGLLPESNEADQAPLGLTKGAGDIVTTAPDMAKWMDGFSGGKLLSAASFSEMTVDYSADAGMSYGYGLMLMTDDGIGHPGNIATYSAVDYMNPKRGLNLFAVSAKTSMVGVVSTLPQLLIADYFTDTDET